MTADIVVTADTRLDELTANIKLKLVENKMAANMFNRTINSNIVEIGQWLTQAKPLIGHGNWQDWLKVNFDMTDRTARNYMKVSGYFGINSILKTENVFRFQPAALIELTKIPVAEVSKFLVENPDAENLSVRNLSKSIKKWKNPAPDTTPVTVEVDAEIKTPEAKVLKLPTPQFHTIPPSMKNTADLAQIDIDINFSRTLKLPDTDILITRLNFSALQTFSTLASGVIYTAADFTRSDDIVKNIRCCIWYFGGDVQNFADHFSKFGNVILLQTQKSLSTMTGNEE